MRGLPFTGKQDTQTNPTTVLKNALALLEEFPEEREMC